MAIDFSDKRVTMVVCPVDGRYGFYALSDLAFKLLHIDIYKQEDYVCRLCFPIPRHLQNHLYR